ncbi:MAG: hypothetical protein ACRERU_23100 [Methylococcales bacterium]
MGDRVSVPCYTGNGSIVDTRSGPVNGQSLNGNDLLSWCDLIFCGETFPALFLTAGAGILALNVRVRTE